jgi:ketosteroid isomerase-like protein
MGSNDLISEIRSLNVQWMEDYKKGDAAAVGSHYTEDAVSLPPHAAAVVGRESIIEYWKEAMKM